MYICIDEVIVKIGDVLCNVSSQSNNTNIWCTINENKAGTYNISVNVARVGCANKDKQVLYNLVYAEQSSQAGFCIKILIPILVEYIFSLFSTL